MNSFAGGLGAQKITAVHLDRHAFISIRQSSQKQVQHTQESQLNQRALETV